MRSSVFFALLLVACAHGIQDPPPPEDAGVDAVAESLQSVCKPTFCGPHTTPAGATLDCGACEAWPGTVCGDNRTPGVCGASCQTSSDTTTCDYFIGRYQDRWEGERYVGQFHGVQFAGACRDPLVIDANRCVLVHMDPADGPCTQCGYYWCCFWLPPM
jgi:hypothetical protein